MGGEQLNPTLRKCFHAFLKEEYMEGEVGEIALVLLLCLEFTVVNQFQLTD